MRILHIADRLTGRGGAYVHVLGILGELTPRHHVVLAVGRREEIEPPCPTVVIPGLDARDDVAVPGLAELFAGASFDVVHVQNAMNPAVLRWAAATGRAVATVQDHRCFCPGRGKWTRNGAPCRTAFGETACAPCFEDPAYFREVLALTRSRLDALGGMPVIVLSEYMRAELAQVGLDPARVHVIPPFVHGLDGGAAGTGGTACVSFVGRLAEAKGVRDAVAAWRLSGVELELVLAGSGPLRAEMEREGARVLGWLGRPQLAALYRRSRAVIVPSRWQEPFGIVGIEALSVGAPLVAWESGGIGEWYPGDLVAWGDVEGLARQLARAADRRLTPDPGPDRRVLMGRLVRLYESIAG